MNKRNYMIIDLINILKGYLIIFSVLALLLTVLQLDAAILNILLLLPATYLSYTIRKRTKHLWTFLLMHFLLISISVLIFDHIILRIIFTLYMVFLSGYSFYQKNKSVYRQENTSLFLCLILVSVNILSYYMEYSNLIPITFGLAVAYILLHLLNMYFLNFSRFLNTNERMANIPYHQIKNSNNTLILCVTSIFFLAMLLFARLPLGNLLTVLGKLIIRLLRAFFSLFTNSEPSEQIEPDNTPEQTDIPFGDLESTEPSYLMKLLETIFQWVFIIAIVVAVIVLILYSLYKLYQYFYAKNDIIVKDKIEFISPFEKNERVKKEGKRSFRSFFSRTNSDTIRKYFYKSITSNASSQDKISKDLTPSQLSEYAMFKNVNDSGITADKKELLTKYYEKARYSNENCSKEDVNAVKKILK